LTDLNVLADIFHAYNENLYSPEMVAIKIKIKKINKKETKT